MSKILKIRRGTITTMNGPKANTVLAAGEIFAEVPATGVGTNLGSLKMGDGTTAYSSLPYFIKSVNLASDTITPATNSQTTSAAALNDVTSGKTIPQLIGALKNAISLTKTEVTTTIDDKVAFPLAIQSGVYGYKTTSGTFVAFRGDSTATYTYATNSTGGTVDMGARNNYRYVNATNVYNKGKSDGVTVHSATYNATTRSNSTGIDLTASHSYRYIRTDNVPNSNSAEYTFPSNDTGGKKDLGATNTYRYVTATNVYNKGKADGVTTHTGTYTLTWDSDFGKTKDLGVNHTYRYISVPNKPTSLDVSKIKNYNSYDISMGRHITLKSNAVVGKEYLMMAYIENNSVTKSDFLSYMYGFSIKYFKNMYSYTYLLQIVATATEIYNQGSIGNQNSIDVSITDMDSLN